MVDPAHTGRVLARLHAHGLHIAIDDFGTGYSSLANLKRLPVDEIKIDKSFTSEMAGSSNRGNIVRASVDLGHSLRLEIVAEGVEDARTWDLLAALGCDLAQGYLVSRPIPAEEVLPWLSRWDSARTGERKPGVDQAVA